MAANKVRKTNGDARKAAWLVLALVLVVQSAGVGLGQSEPVRPARAREALRLAIEAYKRFDYETAAMYFAHAQSGQQNLTTTDQQDLANLSAQNSIALKGRQEGHSQLERVEEAIKQNKLSESIQLLSALEANQYLTSADQQKRAELNRQTQTQSAHLGRQGTADAKSLLAAARAALQKEDYAAAEALANQAEKASSVLPAWMQPWNDSPAKLRRDIQWAKSKQQPLTPLTAKVEVESKDGSWMPNMKNWFGRTDKTEKPTAAADPVAADPNANKTTVTTTKFLSMWFGQAAGTKKESAPTGSGSAASERTNDEQLARQLIGDGFKAMQANELELAKQLAYKAKELVVTYGANEPTPDALLHEIQRRAANPKVRAQSNILNPVVQDPNFPNPAGPNPAAANPMAGDPAVQNQAPRQLAPSTSTDPRVLLREGRALLQKKNFDDADKVCNQVMNSGARWGLFEDTPEKLRRDIQSGRQSLERDESIKVMAEARKQFMQGNYEEAERKAYHAKHLHGPYGVFDFSDRPEKLLDEIHRMRLVKGREAIANAAKQKQLANNAQNVLPNNTPPGGPPSLPPGNPQVVKSMQDAPNVIGPPPPLVPAGIQNANKNRAIVMVREARELERQGMLSAARQKATETKALQVTFLPEEDSPDSVLLSLRSKIEQQVQDLLQKVTLAAATANHPQHFGAAQAQLATARQLVLEFGLDSRRVDQKAIWLQQVMAGGNPNAAAPQYLPPAQDVRQAGTISNDNPLQMEGRKKLEHAQTELSHGKYAQARKMAEALFHPMYGIQPEVMRFIRTIDAEEFNVRVLNAKRTFDAGMDAYVQKNNRKAMDIFQTIDPLLLPEQYQARLRDVMATREMQPESLQLVQYAPAQPKAPLSSKDGPAGPKLPGAGANDDQENYLDNRNALEKVQFQALRQRGLEARKTAAALFKDKDNHKEQAINTLRQYLEQVNLAQLDAEKSALLRRDAEQRIQQYQTQMAQDKLLASEKKSRYTSQHNETERQKKIQSQQQDIAEKMKLVNENMKQNKLKEADVLVKQIRQIDPENEAAFAAAFQIEIKRNQQIYDKETHSDERFHLNALGGGLGKYASMEDPILFDRERLERRQKGGSGAIWSKNTNPKERAIEYRLMQPISLHFKNVPLHQAIKDLAIHSGVQVAPDYRALEAQNINLNAPLSVSVEEISMKSALNLLLNPLRLTYVIDNEVLMVTTEERTKGRLHRVTYPVADLVILPENHPMPDVYNVQKSLERMMMQQTSAYGMFQPPGAFPSSFGTPVSTSMKDGLGSSFGSNGYSSGSPSSVINGSTTGPKERTPDAMAVVLQELIQNAVAKNSWEQVGGQGGIQYFPMGMALVINQTQEVQEEIMQLLESLRKLQDLQVAVELRAVLVSETFFERIGVDFDMNIRTPTSQREPDLVAGNFVPAPFVNRTGAGLGGLISGLTPAGTLTPDLNIPIRNSTFNFTTPQFGGYQPEAGLSLGLAFLSDIQVFMFLEAVQGDRRAHIMQAPKITVFNGQFATIGAFVARPQVTSVQPVSAPSGQVIMIPQTNVITFGLGMSVQPVVSPDRRFIRLNVSPQLSAPTTDPAGAIVTAIPQFFQGQFNGGAAQPAFFNTPLNVTINPLPVQLTVANTTVNVPDGGTVLLGGFKFLAEERSEYGPPLLSKIPYLSRLFRNVGWSRDGGTLMYLVTARIIMVEEEEQIFLGNQAPIPGR